MAGSLRFRTISAFTSRRIQRGTLLLFELPGNLVRVLRRRLGAAQQVGGSVVKSSSPAAQFRLTQTAAISKKERHATQADGLHFAGIFVYLYCNTCVGRLPLWCAEEIRNEGLR